MPNLPDLLESVRRILGPRATEMPADEVFFTLSQRGEHALAAEIAGRLLPAGRAPAYISIAPPRFDTWMDPQLTPPPRTRANHRDDVAAFLRLMNQADRSRSTTRPPATPPTSTTTIGEPAAVDADYAALVAELGINSAAVDLERFKALVPELGLHVYARAEVQEYLHSLYKVPVGDLTPTVVWGWRPLREKDRSALGQVQYNGRVQRSAPIYSKPIPYPVLLTVKAVRDACPSARFYVSDEMQGEQIPDPFLLVEIAGQQFVIERWDEPAFRAKA